MSPGRNMSRFVPIVENGGATGFFLGDGLEFVKTGRESFLDVKLADRTAISKGETGLDIRTDGSSVSQSTGSPVRLTIADNGVARQVQRVALAVVQNTTDIATKASQADLDTLAGTTADFDTAGLARKAEDPGELTIDTGDVAGSLAAIRDAYNSLRQAMLDAGLIGVR